MGIQGFWSYVHADDDANASRITQLSRDVAAEFAVLTGETFQMFLDKDAIKWGESWRERIDESLAAGAFFIPVLTPRYFLSSECRRELLFFARKARELGARELVLPILYVDVAALHDPNDTDELVRLVGTFQWEDWRDARFADLATETYRRAVSRLAARLASASLRNESAPPLTTVVAVNPRSGPADDTAPGFLDEMAKTEDAIPRVTQAMETFNQEASVISKILDAAKEEAERVKDQRLGFSARLAIASRMAHNLSPPVDRVSQIAEELTSNVYAMDVGVRMLIQRAEPEVKEKPETRQGVATFLDVLRSLGDSAQGSLAAAQTTSAIFADLEGLSKDFRPVARRLRQSIIRMAEGYALPLEWAKLAKEVTLPPED